MFANSVSNVRSSKILAGGEGESFTMMGLVITPKVTGEDTQGAYCVIEQQATPGAGSPPHYCHAEEKTFYILDGEFDVLVGERVEQAKAGDVVFIPRGTLHNYKNTGLKPGRLLAVLIPSGHENFLRELSQLFQNGRPTMEQMQAVSAPYQVELVPPKGA